MNTIAEFIGRARSRFHPSLWLCLLLIPGVSSALPALDERVMEVGGLTRTFYLHAPSTTAAGRPLPLVLVLHGGGGAGESAARQTGFVAESDRAGFMVVFPEGTGRARPLMKALGRPGLLTWNAGNCCGYAAEHGVDDVGFIRALVARLERDYPIDPHRIYATGLSNGGMMAYRLACEAGDLFAAIAPVSAVQVTTPCAARAPVSLMHIHGTADQNVLVEGGLGGKALNRDVRPPVADSIAFWARRDGCDEAPARSRVLGHVTLERYGGCRAGTAVDYYLIDGGGHAWPGGDRLLRLLDAPDPEVPATRMIWQFFAAHPKS